MLGAINCLRVLIELGADVNRITSVHPLVVGRPHAAQITQGQSPLHFACIYEQPSCAEALCKAGASLNATDEVGFTPLHHALRSGHRRVVMTLLRAGAAPIFPFTAPSPDAALSLACAVKRAGDWAAYVRQHKRILVGLVTKCRPVPDDAAGLIVEFMCLPGGF